MTRADQHQLLNVIDRLYAATLDAGQWQPFLTSLATMFEAQNAFVCEVDQNRRALDYVGLPQPNRERVPVKRYETLIEEDPRTAIFRSRNARAVHCRTDLSTARLHASRVYRDYLRPLDIEYTMVVRLPVRDGTTRDLGLTRGRAGRSFDSNDCDLLNTLVPHLGRSCAIRHALAQRGPSQRPIDAVLEDEADRLQRLFALSPSQTRLTLSLFDGLTVKDAAIKLGLTEGTARQYLKRVFAKTGVRRQPDLIRRVARALQD